MLVLGSTAAASAGGLTSANSIAMEFFARSTAAFTGADCTTPVTADIQLPAGVSGVRVVEPKVGDRIDGTRVTTISINGSVVTIGVVADRVENCQSWQAEYDVRSEYTRRVQATMRVFFESYLFGAKWQVRPTTIRDTRRGGAPGERFTGIRWKSFGGKTAIGYGTLHQDFCRSGDNCPEDGKRARLVATHPGYCSDSGKVEYIDLAIYHGGRFRSGLHLQCS
jgi:hypothetical protein